MQIRYPIIYFSTVIFIFLPVILQTRQVILPCKKTPGESDKIINFIPKGYAILDTISGDLNGDNFPDMIMLLRKNGEDTMNNPAPKRLLMILKGLPNKE